MSRFNSVAALADEIEKVFGEYPLARRNNIPLSIDDGSGLLFVSAAISTVRKQMLAAEHIDECFVIQPCFRYHKDYEALFNFSMLGLFANYSSASSLAAKLFFLLDRIGFDNKRVYAVVKEGNQSILRLLETHICSENIYTQTKNNEFYSVDWCFGSDQLIGEGLTLAYKQQTECQCDQDSCSLLNGCTKFIPFGNIIWVKNLANNCEYIDIGFGMESILKALSGGSYYSLAPASTVVNELIKEGVDEQRAKRLTRNLLAIKTLLDEGIEVSNKKQGYILRRLIRGSLDDLVDWKVGMNIVVNLLDIDAIGKEVFSIDVFLGEALIELLKQQWLEYVASIRRNLNKVYDKQSRGFKHGIDGGSLSSTYGINESIVNGIRKGLIV